MILDTCALLWLAQGGGKLSKIARGRINEAPVVYISAISAFEIGAKQRRAKLDLPALASDWLKAILDHHGIAVLPLDLAICLRAAELPAIHKDPCDRFIIATAQLHELPVVTADTVFREYGVEVIA